MATSQYIGSELNHARAKQFLTSHRWPDALQNNYLQLLTQTPVRFMIVDNSGSMFAIDGQRCEDSGEILQFVQCSRWAELVASVTFHADFAYASGAVTEFRILNGCRPVVLGNIEDDGMELKFLKENLAKKPQGQTPLCRHIREVTNSIRDLVPLLEQSGQRAMLIIATDGESSDGDLAEAMAPLKHLPVHVIIRLCTDSEAIQQYWEAVDRDLELEFDLLDDLVAEAKAIYDHNPWLTYSLALHRMREFGVTVKELDMIDECKLSGDQIRSIAALICGGTFNSYPHPQANAAAFAAAFNPASTPNVWSPITGKIQPYIIPTLVGKSGYEVSGGGTPDGCCAIM